MLSSRILTLVTCIVPFVRGEVSLPLVDLGYALHQGTIEVWKIH